MTIACVCDLLVLIKRYHMNALIHYLVKYKCQLLNSRGSVATRLRRGGIFIDHFVANFLHLNVPVKIF